MKELYLNDVIKDRPIEDTRYILKKFYDDAYSSGIYKPGCGKITWEHIAGKVNAEVFEINKCLDVGCGTGTGIKYAREQGWNVFGCDIADISMHWKKNNVEDYCTVASAMDLPYKDEEFDFVMCNDVLEHIHEDDILLTLKEIFRICKRLVFLSICLVHEWHPVKGFIFSHICLKPVDWWIQKILKAGFTDLRPWNGEHHLTVWGYRPRKEEA